MFKYALKQDLVFAFFSHFNLQLLVNCKINHFPGCEESGVPGEGAQAHPQ